MWLQYRQMASLGSPGLIIDHRAEDRTPPRRCWTSDFVILSSLFTALFCIYNVTHMWVIITSFLSFISADFPDVSHYSYTAAVFTSVSYHQQLAACFPGHLWQKHVDGYKHSPASKALLQFICYRVHHLEELWLVSQHEAIDLRLRTFTRWTFEFSRQLTGWTCRCMHHCRSWIPSRKLWHTWQLKGFSPSSVDTEEHFCIMSSKISSDDCKLSSSLETIFTQWSTVQKSLHIHACGKNESWR